MTSDAAEDGLWARVQVGERLEPFEYAVTEEMLKAYRATVGNSAAAYPTVAGRHPLRAFVQKYGKQTLMNAGVEAEYFGAVRPGSVLRVSATVVDKYIKRGKPYIIVEATTTDDTGRLIEKSRLIGLAAQSAQPLFSEVARKWETD